tara:strand:- start:120 stop:491 length:372 start_codon:yes stop_codon:yes gene_type:complete
MAVSSATVPGSFIGTTVIEDTDSDNTPEDASGSGGTLHQVYIDNSANSAQVYVKLYEAAKGSVTVGTTPPSFIFPCPASKAKQFNFASGAAWSTALSFATVTAAGTGGNTGPTDSVIVRLTIG